MENFDIPSILSYGVIGLGFLLAFLTFRLLSNEQKNEKPRKSILNACYLFMVFSLILTGFGFASEIFGSSNIVSVVDEKDRNKIENDLRTGLISFFRNQDEFAPRPSRVMGEAKSIVRNLQVDPNTFNNIQMEIERRKKNDNNWTFANILTDALALVNSLGLDNTTETHNEIFLKMPLPEVTKHEFED